MISAAAFNGSQHFTALFHCTFPEPGRAGLRLGKFWATSFFFHISFIDFVRLLFRSRARLFIGDQNPGSAGFPLFIPTTWQGFAGRRVQNDLFSGYAKNPFFSLKMGPGGG